MKQLIKIFLLLFFLTGKLFAQDVRVEIVNAPDTVSLNDTHTLELYVFNENSTASVSNGISLYYEVNQDTNTTLYLGAVFNTIGPSSKKPFKGDITFDDKNQNFMIGDNIVIVWPTYHNGQIGIADTFWVHVRREADGVGIEEYWMDEKAAFYPNPANGPVSIHPAVAAELLGLKIYDAQGKVVFSKTQDFQRKLYLGMLPKGVYILELEHQKGDILRKKLLILDQK